MPIVLGVKDGSLESNVTLEKRGQLHVICKEFSKVYTVLSDNANQTDDDIRHATGVPPLLYPLNGALCKSQHPRELETVVHPVTGVKAILWEVTCRFNTDLDPDEQQAPEAKRPRIRRYTEIEEEVLEKDPVTGKPIQTDAGEPIILTRPVPNTIMEITRYELYPFDPMIPHLYVGTFNSVVFWGAPRCTAEMLGIETNEETLAVETPEGTTIQVPYELVTYRIRFRIRRQSGSGKALWWDTCMARVLHHGSLYRPGPGEEPKIFKVDGYPATCNLVNGVGTKKPDGSPPDYLTFNRNVLTDFNALSLGPF